MTNDITDRERIWTDTQEWLDDIDRDEPGADFDAPAADLGSVADDDHNDAPLPASAASAADGGDDQADYGPADDNDRSAHIDTAPVDLDAAGPDPAAGNADAPDTADHPDPAPTAHTPADTEGTASRTTPTPQAIPTTRRDRPATTRRSPQDSPWSPCWPPSRSAAHCWPCAAVHTPPTHRQAPTPAPGQRSCRATTTSAPAAGNQDSTIPYTATSVGCLPGSTAAQSVAGPNSTQAWVCVTGGNIGQYLVLNLGRSMVITAVSITPGWVGADPPAPTNGTNTAC